MKRLKSPVLFLHFIFLLSPFLLKAQQAHPSYPEAEQVRQVDNYHGMMVSDPYRWMEDTQSPETRAWIDDQEAYLKQYLDNDQERVMIRKWIDKLGETGSNYSVPVEAGGQLYYTINKPELKHNVIYRQAGEEGKAEVIFDPNQEFKEEQSFGGFSVSPDGQTLVYFSRSGQNRWGDLSLYSLKEKQHLPVSIEGTASAGVAWNAHGTGFYYLSYGKSKALNEGNSSPKTTVHFHQIGSSVAEDKHIYSQPDNPNLLISIMASHDRKAMIMATFEGRSDRNKVYWVNQEEVKPLFEDGQYRYNFIGNRGDQYYFFSNKEAPNGKVISVDLRHQKIKTIIAEQEATLAGGSSAGGNAMNLIGEHLVLLYRVGTRSSIRVFDLKGREQHHFPLETGWIGSGLVGHPQGDKARFSLNTFLDPSTVYQIDLKTGKIDKFFNRPLPIDANDYVTENILYPSKDGTSIPLYIAYKKGLKKDGSNPVFMYGYGFGGWVAVPWYQPQLLTWLELGGIYVLPGVRGGGEFGDAWRDAGIRLNRQNAIDDYIAAAQWLVDQQYTSPGKVVANGWSASGSLAAAATMQRPDLFGAAMIGIPSLDMLRYQHFTAFKGWTRSYGSSDNKAEFEALYRWSPYQNIRQMQCYPPMLVTVGEKDQTTPPQHGYKFVAALQQHQNCGQPVLLKIVRGAGHSFGTSSEQSKETYTDELLFLVKVLGLKTKVSGP